MRKAVFNRQFSLLKEYKLFVKILNNNNNGELS